MVIQESLRKVTVIFILTLSVELLFNGILLAYNLKEYFPLRDGDTLVYKAKREENGVKTFGDEITKIKGSEKINKIMAKKIVSLKNDNRCVAIDSEGVKLYKTWGWFNGDYEIYEPPKLLFPDIKIGEKRQYQVNGVLYDIRDVEDEKLRESGTVTVTLDSMEDVEVPAGKFKDCLKYTLVYEFSGIYIPESGKEIVTTWLAPGIGRVKSFSAFTKYNSKTKKEDKLSESLELIQASINGNMVPAGSPEFSDPVGPP